MAKKKNNKTDYKKKFKKLKVKYKKLREKLEAKPKKGKNKKKIKSNNIFSDHSSPYNVDDAVKKLRSLINADQIEKFTKDEKRVTITRTVKGVLNRLEN